MPPNGFIPDRDSRFYLLRQHRQPLAENVTRKYIVEFTAPGDLVIDPFAASAITARVAIELESRCIAVDSNPLVAFAARLQASLPAPRELTNALSRLGEIQKEDESLRAHLDTLYASACANCGAATIVDYFVWSLELNAPVEKVYECARCGNRRDATTDADRLRAAEFKPHSLQYHLLLDRITGDTVVNNQRVRELLKLYTPRNLYSLVTLTLKMDAEFAEVGAARDILSGCLIHALDVGTTLYSSPDALPERKTPEQFVEMNIWRAFERASLGLMEQAPGARLANAPSAVLNSSMPLAFVGHGRVQDICREDTLGQIVDALKAAVVIRIRNFSHGLFRRIVEQPRDFCLAAAQVFDLCQVVVIHRRDVVKVLQVSARDLSRTLVVVGNDVQFELSQRAVMGVVRGVVVGGPGSVLACPGAVLDGLVSVCI